METLVDIPIVFGLTLITFQLSAAWLSFVYSARDMPWLQLTMCESPVCDALPSRTRFPLPFPLPFPSLFLFPLHAAVAFDCRLWRWWLPRLTRLEWGMICVARKAKTVRKLVVSGRQKKKQSLNDVPPLAAYTARTPCCTSHSICIVLSQHTQCSSERGTLNTLVLSAVADNDFAQCSPLTWSSIKR